MILIICLELLWFWIFFFFLENVDMFGNLFLTFIRKEDNEKHVKYIDNRLHLVPKNVKFAFSGLFDDVAKGNFFYDFLLLILLFSIYYKNVLINYFLFDRKRIQ